MVRSCMADDHLLTYLTTVAKQNTCVVVGLILGQTSLGKDYIIHFAKTPPFQQTDGGTAAAAPETAQSDCVNPATKTGKTKLIKSINDVNEAWVADHARHATRMLPGGMHVLGIFIVSQDDLVTSLSPKIKSILNQIHTQLGSSKYLYGNPDSNEKIVLNYITKDQQYLCKSYDVVTTSVKPTEFKFMPRATKWNQLECKYEMDQIYHVRQTDNDWSLKKHMNVILDNINENLKAAVFLYDGEIKEMDENLENIGKKKKGLPRSAKAAGQKDSNEKTPMIDTHDKAFQVSILQSCHNLNASDKMGMFEVTDSDGQIRIVGQVGCKLWLHPKVSIKMASEAVTQDIMRSLATRLEMHWDSLTEEEGSSEDVNSIHEPPRRVLVTLPNSKITLSDYLFPGEGPQDAQLSLQEMLDIKIANKDEIQDIEGQAELSEYYTDVQENDSEETLPKLPADTSKFMYIFGMGVALLVLIISLLIHFFK